LLKRYNFRPGIIRDVTQYTNEQGWFDADKVRFFAGFPEMIGGWTRLSDESFKGTPRALIAYSVLDGTNLIGIGTTVKYYLNRGGTYYDITPIRQTTNPLANNPFSTVDDSNIVTVSDPGHGAGLGDFVTFSGATDFNGLTAATDLNIEHQIINVIDANSYQILSVNTATATGAGGGAVVVAEYQASIGLDAVVPGTGWGAGAWGSGPWGGPASTSVPGSQIRIWNHDNWGEDLFFNIYDGAIYFWDHSTSTLGVSRGVDITTLGGDTDVPTIAKKVMLSDVARHLIAFGCDDLSSTVQDPMMVRWSQTEDYLVWTPDTTNQAGSYRLESGSKIITACKARNETLIWTDTSLYTMQYTGDIFVFRFNLSSNKASIVGPNAYATVENLTFWMDYGHFNVYNGSVSLLECPIQRYIFNDFNYEQRFKCFAAPLHDFNEIWWFYPSANSEEIDKYVIFNYLDNTWSIGNLFRSSWIEPGFSETPVAGNYYVYESSLGTDPFATVNASSTVTVTDVDHGAIRGDIVYLSSGATFNGFTGTGYFTIHTIIDDDTYLISIPPTAAGSVVTATGTGSGGGASVTAEYARGYLYYQETTNNDELGNPINAYVESTDFDLDDGDHLTFIRRVVPDVTFSGSGIMQTVDFSMKVRTFPGSTKQTKFVRTISPTTTQVWDRARTRQASVKWESNVIDTKWRLGSLRLDINTDGMKE
jgi:hypothetical protein